MARIVANVGRKMTAMLSMQTLGILAWPLLFCALLLVAVVGERLCFTAWAVWHRQQVYADLLRLLERNRECEKSLRDDVLALQLQALSAQWLRGHNVLRGLAAVSPLLGMLGTIIGVMSAFQRLSEHRGAVNPALLADGLWQALTTTAVGLAIALVAVVLASLQYSVCRGVLQRWQAELNQRSLGLAGAKLASHTALVEVA